MKLKHNIVILTAALTLVGCTVFRPIPVTKKPPRNPPSDDASIKLAESANSVSDSLVELARIQAAATPPVREDLVEPYAYDMQIRASIDWSGPVEPLLSRIALASHYRVRILGTEPAIPVLVNISVKDQTLGDTLRDLDFQVRSNNKAVIVVYPRNKTIEIRYVKP